MNFSHNKIGAWVVGIALFLGVALAPPTQAQENLSTLGSCVPDATHLCFLDRFSAVMTYQTPGGAVSATAVQPAGGNPGYFRFGNVLVAELWMDVLDACAINSFYWVTFLGVSEEGWQLRVDDTQTSFWKSYTVPVGSFGPPVTQTDSFACAPAAGQPTAATPNPLLGNEMDLGDNGRFRVTATRPSMVATANQLTRDSGLLSFFSPSEPNLLIKMLQPGLTPAWIGLVVCVNETDVTVNVLDRCTGVTKSYFRANPTTFADYDAFPADDSPCSLFSDGFESGDTSGWSVTSP